MTTLELIQYKALVDMALQEDIGTGDLTALSTISESVMARALIYAKQAGVVCGLTIANYVFGVVDPALVVLLSVQEGAWVEMGTPILEVQGPARSILSAERTVLNFLARLSGIATTTHGFVSRIGGTKARICDTRKTTPGWRYLEKYAVATGGGLNHRIGLWDAILIKENHIKAAGGITQAIQKARVFKDRVSFIQIEVESLDQLEQALLNQPDMVLLDNMDIPTMIKSVEICQKSSYNILIEASGNVNIDNVAAIAQTGVDRISIGAITHSAINFDYSLLITED